MENKKNRFFYLEYTLLFSLIAGIILFFYYSQGKSMINFGGDGFRQHYRGLVYYSNYLKDFFKNLFKGSFSFPQWDFVLGEGNDVLKTLHYYCVGDILTFFSFLCPEKYMYIYYDFATILRMYCAGLSFSALCFYKKKSNYYVNLAGSILFAFSSFCLFSMTGHVFFISAAVYLPLMILGAEMIINNDKPYVFIIGIALSALSNIYFFYMNVISTIIFVLVRLLLLSQNVKYKYNKLIQVTFYSLIGLGLGCIVFLPMLSAMFQNTRLDSDVSVELLFPLNDYIAMVKGLTFEGDAYSGGYSIFWPMAISTLFLKKKNKTTITLLIIGILFMCLPYLSSIYNGFVYPTNRWFYAMSLLVLYIFVDSFENIEDINKYFIINIILVIIYYGICFVIDKDIWQIHVLLLLISIFALVFIKLNKKQFISNLLVISIVVFTLLLRVYFDYGPSYWNMVSHGSDIAFINNMINDEHSVFDSIEDDSFYRYSGHSLASNQAVQGNKSSTQYYWSIANDYVVEFRKQLSLSDKSVHHYDNYDERFSLNALSGVKYYVNEKGEDIPFGFSYFKEINGYDIYRSDNSLPLLFSYDNYVLTSDYEELNSAIKNEVLLQAGVVDKDLHLIDKKNVQIENVSIPYAMTISKDIKIDKNSIDAFGEKPQLYLDCKYDVPGEYYVMVEGLYSNKSTSYVGTLYKDVDKYFIFKGNDNQHYTDRHNYMVNLGYMDSIDGTVTLDFSDGGIYQYDSIEVICQPLDSQIEYTKQLKSLVYNNLVVNKDRVSVDIETKNNKLVCFSIPFSKGWNAYVDGKKAELLNCNIQYMAIELENGKHHVELKYSTPLLSIGTAISFVSFCIFVYMLYKDKKTIVK